MLETMWPSLSWFPSLCFPAFTGLKGQWPHFIFFSHQLFIPLLSVVHARSPSLGTTCLEQRYQVTSRSKWTISNNNLKPKARRRVSENLEAKGILSQPQKNNIICHWSFPVSDQKYSSAGGTAGQTQAISPAWAALIDKTQYIYISTKLENLKGSSWVFEKDGTKFIKVSQGNHLKCKPFY